MKNRIAEISRRTSETDIFCRLDLDGTGICQIETGVGFFDHVLESFARHGKFDLILKCAGDLKTGAHHSIEDCALVLGESFKKAAGEKIGIERFGFEKISAEEILPMDEAIAFLAADFSGRPFLKFAAKFKNEKVADFPTEMVAHFLQSFSVAAGLNLHAKIDGENDHHQIEVLFKSLGRVLRKILKISGAKIPSTKGSL